MSEAIRFLLNDEPVSLADVDPTSTLLNWLRYTRGLTASKEGCAEGDCGACTVVLRRAVAGKVETLPVCSCILMLGMVHGCDVVTVDGITAPNGTLHPVQRAISEGHGSQCGFCTPGFVASLWAHYRSGKSADPDCVKTALAGNLCRCTGYGPLIDAPRLAQTLPPADWDTSDAEVLSRLKEIAAGPLQVDVSRVRFAAPETVQELAAHCSAHPEARIVSGATDVGLWLTKQDYRPDHVVHTGRIEEFRKIEVIGTALHIGAGATFADLLPWASDFFPDFASLLKRIGGAQIRALGTIGGNIANGSPIGDTPPAFIALAAKLLLRKGDRRRELEVEDFFERYGVQDLEPGEIVEAVIIPDVTSQSQLWCHKISKRHDQDITSVLGCFQVIVDGGIVTSARLSFGGMAGTPARAPKAEAALIGAEYTKTSIEGAQLALKEDFVPLTDHRGSAEFRMSVARNLLMRFYLERNARTAIPRLSELT